jgi:hypothetical protein
MRGRPKRTHPPRDGEEPCFGNGRAPTFRAGAAEYASVKRFPSRVPGDPAGLGLLRSLPVHQLRSMSSGDIA